jgi:DNA-binding NarL/FixJ family response regulator
MIRVLVVDDHAFVRDSVIAALEGTTDLAVVGSCADGQQAIEELARVRPDVILMDLSMPVLDGVEATRRIVAQDPGARIVIFTSAAGDRRITEALAAGAVECIYKDADIPAMVDTVRRVAGPPILGAGIPL